MMDLKQLVEECKKHGIDITPLLPKSTTEFNYTATAYFERGFGPEYITIQTASAKNITEAQQKAEEVALTYLKGHSIKAEIKEVRIRPA